MSTTGELLEKLVAENVTARLHQQLLATALCMTILELESAMVEMPPGFPVLRKNMQHAITNGHEALRHIREGNV